MDFFHDGIILLTVPATNLGVAPSPALDKLIYINCYCFLL